MRIASAQINSRLTDFNYNKNLILKNIEVARQENVELLVFPECALFGYHPFDLLEHKSFVQKQLKAFREIQKKIPANMCVILGLITETNLKKGRPYYNSLAVLQKNKKPLFYHKQLLPTGDVFDEGRYIESGDGQNQFFKFKNKNILLTICEDIWAWPDSNGTSVHRTNPLAKIKNKKVDLVINLSASPFYSGKLEKRHEVIASTAKYFKAPVLYTNLVGAQDEITFDGQSLLMNSRGQELFRMKAFEEDFLIFDLEDVKKIKELKLSKKTNGEQIRQALVLGIRDFCQKTGIQKIHLGLSGGIDSALVACLATEAIGADNVKAIALPSPFNQTMSLDLAKQLAKNLQIEFIQMSISEAYEVAKKSVDQSYGITQFSVVHENIQARLRGLYLMAYSNHQNSLLLTTSNKSEYAAGYSTLYGDMCGGLAPIGDLTKKQVYELAKIYNKKTNLIPELIITRAPSAELRPNQKDQDSLPEYNLLDQSVVKLIEKSSEPTNATDRFLISQLYRTEFKRWQAPPILKVSARTFGKGRKWPISFKSN